MKWLSIVAGLLLALQPQVIQVDVQYRQVTASVQDSSGRFVPGLKAEDFVLEEDGVPQDIENFAGISDASGALGILVDNS